MNSGKNFDFAIVGGGIAGVAVGAELARLGSVILLERETSLSYHTTGRSAAISMESYGNPLIRRLTCASRAFFENPPEAPLMAPRGALIVGEEANWSKLKARFQVVKQQVPTAQLVDRKDVAALAPFMADKWIAGIHEPSAFDLDVHAIHSLFLKRIRARGGSVLTGAEIAAGSREVGAWRLTLTDGQVVRAGKVVNAAGAWADVLAERCGVRPLGVQPLLRTVAVVEPGMDVSRCPYVGTVDEFLFIKPDVGRLIVSPCDETLSSPCDALPDEMGVAITMDRLERSTTLRPKRVLNRWAGLRVFVSDRSPIVGPDPSADGFIWCAALGGYGIQTAPAMSSVCASLATGTELPRALQGIDLSGLAPARLTKSQAEPPVAVAELQ